MKDKAGDNKEQYIKDVVETAHKLVAEKETQLLEIKKLRASNTPADQAKVAEMFKNDNDLVNARAYVVLGAGLTAGSPDSEEAKYFDQFEDNESSAIKMIDAVSEAAKLATCGEVHKKCVEVVDTYLLAVKNDIERVEKAEKERAENPTPKDPEKKADHASTFFDFGLEMDSSTPKAKIISTTSGSPLTGIIPGGATITKLEIGEGAARQEFPINSKDDLRTAAGKLGSLLKAGQILKVHYMTSGGVTSEPAQLTVKAENIKEQAKAWGFKFGQNSTGHWFTRAAHEGARVTAVVGGADVGSASVGDLKKDDVIHSVTYKNADGQEVTQKVTDNPETPEKEIQADKSSIYLEKILALIPAGSSATFEVERGGQSMQIVVTPGRKIPAFKESSPASSYSSMDDYGE